MADSITLLLVKYSNGNIAICQFHFVNNGVLNGYTKAMIITMTAIIIALQLGVCKSRMAHNGRGYAVVLMPYSLCCVSVGGD